jgi:nitrate/TMAO reductase-like tetraheme cytochrome c subunit
MSLGAFIRWVSGWLRRQPLPALMAIVAIAAAAMCGVGYYAYGTYDYVQHDNDFCLSCHLMQDPFERFARSAHRGLGCKACHQPTLIERSTMGLTQIVENPDSLGVHAEVPNAVCEDCHVKGDPEVWTVIASSAGHRIHLESTDSVLEGIRCVECHSTSVHEFASVDRTCAQSSCHVESTVRLGAMSDLTIHCVACHSFSEPTPAGDGAAEFQAALAPDRDTCLSCHEMRVLVEMPDPDPHGGSCAACHNPHTQDTPADAAETCASAGCHDSAEGLTPFHEGVADHVGVDCLYCHQAHDFAVDGSNCTACHTRILEDDPSVPRGRGGGAGAIAVPDPPRRAAVRQAALTLHADVAPFAAWSAAVPGMSTPRGAPTAQGAPTSQEAPTFLHSRHADYACTDCHSSATTHGAVTVSTIEGCRDCHHTERVDQTCASCHEESGSTTDPHPVAQTFRLLGGEVQRIVPFDHGRHGSEDCATCHTEGLGLSAAPQVCASCHEDHHEPERACMSCHEPVPAEAHPIERAHVTCTGSGCHTDGPFTTVPRTRQVCLGCHQDLVDHRPEEPNCAQCHALPDPGSDVLQ